MIRLGMRLALHSGREAFTRLLLTTVAVALGVAVLLGVLAEFHAFQADASMSCWECTQGSSVPKTLGASAPGARAGRGELWNYSVDYFEGRTIERLDVAALGPQAKATVPILHDLGYYMHDGGHGMVPADWDVYLDFLKAHLHPER